MTHNRPHRRLPAVLGAPHRIIKILAPLAAVAALTGLAACGGDDGPPENEAFRAFFDDNRQTVCPTYVTAKQTIGLEAAENIAIEILEDTYTRSWKQALGTEALRMLDTCEAAVEPPSEDDAAPVDTDEQAPAPPVTTVPPTTTPTQPEPPTTQPSHADDELADLVNDPDVAGFVGPFALADGTGVAMLTRWGPDVLADGTVELLVERADGWQIEQTLAAGNVTGPETIGDVTGDGVPEIKVLMTAMTVGKGWDVLYRIDADGPKLREIPFDTDALSAMGIDAMSLHIEAGAVGGVATTIGTCTPSCAEDAARPVSWTLDRTAGWLLRPEPVEEGACTSAAIESDTGVSTQTATCADGWAVGVQPDCFEECEGAEVFRLDDGRWTSVGYHYAVFADSLSSSTGMPMETARQLAWFSNNEEATSQPTVLQRGDQGPEVTALQQELARLGYGIEMDGTFGPGTENAVREFQRQSGLDVDGMAGLATLTALGLWL